MTLVDRLGAALARGMARDIALLPGDGGMADHGGDNPRPAAVLVPVTDRAEPGVILTRRTENLSRHPGQVAFPGGRVDAEDADEVAAALREAEEELALPRASVTIIGRADAYRTITGYHVTPVLGVVPANLPLVPNAGEVADWFEAPLAFLLDPANHRRASTMFQGRERHYIEIMWGGHRIWGATAAMIVNLSRRLDGLA